MVSPTISDKTVCVVGLGYVGLPLAEDFSRHLRTIGFRRDQKKVDELNATEGNKIEATTDPAKKEIPPAEKDKDKDREDRK